MSKLRSISGKDCIKALEKIGFYEKRRESGHIINHSPYVRLIDINKKTEILVETTKCYVSTSYVINLS